MILTALTVSLLGFFCGAPPNVDNTSGFTVLPLDHSTAPRSTRIWAQAPAGELTLSDGDTTIQTTEQVIRVAGTGERTIVVLTPTAELTAGKRYTVWSGLNRRATFTVSDEVDTTPPSSPAVAVGVVEGGDGHRPSQAALTLTPAPQLSFVVDAPSGDAQLPENAWSLGQGDTVRALDLPPGEQRLAVVAFDLSGNIAMSNPIALTVPEPTRSGCSAAPAGPALLAALALLIARARRAGR